MTGGFHLIDSIFYLFLGKPYHMPLEHLENGTSRKGKCLWHFNPFSKKIEEVYNSLNGQVQAFFI